MSRLLHNLFGVDQPVIAMVHLPGLPGRPRHDRSLGMDRVIDSVRADVEALQGAGVDGLLFCNEADLPYQLGVGPEIVAATGFIVGAVLSQLRIPFGINLVWDPISSIAVARATGACFVREVFTGVYESDLGIMRPDLGLIASYRESIGANSVALFSNITPEFASTIGDRSVATRASGASRLGVDVVLVSGPMTGTPVDRHELAAAKAAVADTPVLVNTGATTETVAELFRVADGAIVGTHLKYGGVTWNPVDPGRAMAFMGAARSARQQFGGYRDA